jgi:hypothetical protein
MLLLIKALAERCWGAERYGALGRRSTSLLVLGLLVLLVMGLQVRPVWAGLSASQVVVVVNGDSQASRTLANHYVRLREIPARNVIVLRGVPDREAITVEEFRKTILTPLLTEIDSRQLAGRVSCVAYSADFPTAINISEDLKRIEPLPKIMTPVASINALTYFYRWVQLGDPSYAGLDANFYARRPIERLFQMPGGAKTARHWQTIQDYIRQKEHRRARLELEALLRDMPHQYPVAYLAASQAAEAGEVADAVRLLGKAIAGGWEHRQYLEQDSRFEGCRQDPGFQTLLAALDDSPSMYQPPVGFEAATFWSPNGVPGADATSGMAYMLSVVLGVTRGDGTTLEEAIAALQRSATVDFSQPYGGFYFSRTSDVRTQTREPAFADTMAEMQTLGFRAEIVKDKVPVKQALVLGACLGAANFDWAASESYLVPGAIAENLTSHGGIMGSRGGQTKLSELIRAGAAGSSGTVTEPYAIQAKFPHPQLYTHYARGASLAEAFYLNVTGPYQLLIVGDPLCQPFANPPAHRIDQQGSELNHRDTVTLALSPPRESLSQQLAPNYKPPLEPVTIWALLDFAPPQSGAFEPRVRIQLDPEEAPGAHELRLVLVGEGALAIRRELVIPMWVGPPDSVTLETPDALASAAGEPLLVRASAPGAERITLWHDSEQVGVLEGESGELSMDLAQLGQGPVRLHAVAEFGKRQVRSQPQWIRVEP